MAPWPGFTPLAVFLANPTQTELDLAALRQLLSSAHFEPGDPGTVVFVSPHQEAYAVESAGTDSQTIAGEMVLADQVEPAGSDQILHAQDVQAREGS